MQMESRKHGEIRHDVLASSSDTHDFTMEARRAGLDIPQLDVTGALQRVRVDGDKGGQRSGWYVFHLAGASWGVFGNWKTGEQHHWRSGVAQALSDAERERMEREIRRYQQERKQLRAAQYMQARGEALRIFSQAPPADPSHPYLQAKGVGAHGLRQEGMHLVVPMCDGRNRLWSVQRIDAAGNKRFLAGGRKGGLFHLIGPAPVDVVCVAEGYATAASIHEATGYPVAVAFDAGNLEAVALVLRQKHPGVQIVICADDDTATAERIGRNPGLEAAQRAAAKAFRRGRRYCTCAIHTATSSTTPASRSASTCSRSRAGCRIRWPSRCRSPRAG